VNTSHNTLTKIDMALGFDHSLIDNELASVDQKIAAALDLRDNPAVQVAGQYGQQQPSAGLPQLNELLTQLALKQTQEALNKSTAVNDPMVAENERLRRQKENLDLQVQIQEKQQQLQQMQMPQGQPGAQPGAQPGMPQGPMAAAGGPDQAAQMGAVPYSENGQMPPEDFDLLEQLRNTVQAGPIRG